MHTNNETTLANASIETIVALDALEVGSPEASALLVGVPCTYAIGSDRYAGFVVSVSKSLHRIVANLGAHLGDRTFTRRKRGSYVEAGRSCGHLWLGTAENHRDPSF